MTLDERTKLLTAIHEGTSLMMGLRTALIGKGTPECDVMADLAKQAADKANEAFKMVDDISYRERH